ncbi:hypothetical protein PAPHI01_0316 [Pancytospora philotis]|nr:hypothetical protein PAPHI01_0316 [Pancytospora philotis]
MWLNASHRPLLFFTATIAAATEKKIGFREINPFVGAIDTYTTFRDKVIDRMYSRCVTVVNDEKQIAHDNARRGMQRSRGIPISRSSYIIFATLLMQKEPVSFIHEFVKSRLVEYRMLELIFDDLSITGLEDAFDELFPALDRVVLDRIRAAYSSERDAIRQALKEEVAIVMKQSPSEFLRGAGDEIISDDILTYFSLRCETKEHSRLDEFAAILEAIRSEVNEGSHSDAKCISISYFLYNIIGLRYNKEEHELSKLALRCITSSYSCNVIEMLTQQHTILGFSPHHQRATRICAMDKIIDYTCVNNAKYVDPHFVRAYLDAQKKYGMIDNAEEVDFLYTFYDNTDQTRKDMLLAVDDKFPEQLLSDLRQRVSKQRQ